MSRFAPLLVLVPALLAAPVRPQAEQTGWLMFGGTPGRNMVSLTARGLPEEFDPETGKNILWKAALGSRTYGQPIVAGGRVFIGSNNNRPRNPKDFHLDAQGNEEPIDRGVLMCFRAADGKFLWQARHDKLPNGPVNDWPHEGLPCSPTVVGDRVYYVSNRGEVVCADVNGFADGNQGFQGEQYKDPTDADILWSFDMPVRLKVFPHNMSNCCPLVVGNAVYVGTANGVDEGHINIPAPDAPSFIALDKNTGRLLWKRNDPGRDIMHGQWSGPAYAADPVPQVIFPGGDGWLRAFDPASGELLWKFDGNPKGAVYELGGTGTRSDFLAYPVVHGGRVYIGTGQDPEHFSGVGYFWCVDLARAVRNGQANRDRDVSPVNNNFDPASVANRDSALAWCYGGADDRKFIPRDFVFGRTMSTACIVDDVLYLAELQGFLHCLDAKTGKKFWQYDTRGSIWWSPYYADGKVYLATENGDLFVFRHDKSPKVMDPLDVVGVADPKAFNAIRKTREKEVARAYLLRQVEFDAPFRSTPTAVGGVLYVATEKDLYAIGKK